MKDQEEGKREQLWDREARIVAMALGKENMAQRAAKAGRNPAPEFVEYF